MAVQSKKPDPIDVEVGRRIRLQRRLKGMNQRSLGEALGVTFQQVQKYEKGTNRVGASRLSDLSHFLGVPVSYFFESEQSHNDAEGLEAHEMKQFIATSEGRSLNSAFARISDIDVKRQIVALVKALSHVD
jgi:transcriptional regulator with XRE-family HTH domain